MARVLVADDQSDVLQALRFLLTDLRCDVDMVSSVEDVMSHLERQAYDLLLMDLNYSRDTTSGREGLALLDRAHAHDTTLPIVVMTGWGSIDTAVEAMRRGAKSFVQKPWDDAVLAEILERELADGAATRQRDAQLLRDQTEAGLIQRALMPSTMPHIEGCDLAAEWRPASGIGGDCYDVLRFSHTRVGIAIADVIGKGLPAALLMSNLQAAIRAFATSGAAERDVISSVNRLLARNILPGKFVTCCYLTVDATAGVVTFANAGHNPPLMIRADGTNERLNATGVVLGVFADAPYDGLATTISPGDVLVCYTDGITEATNAEGEEFGEARVAAAARAAAADQGAGAVVTAISSAVSAWTGGLPQDDATLIVLKRR